MPENELEFHPYLKIGESLPATRMIVGTFPIYSLTRPGTLAKYQLQMERGDIRFYYGSRSSMFWIWYRLHIDNQIDLCCPKSIFNSLDRKGIAISDVVVSCKRNEYSSKDGDLIQKEWNRSLASIVSGRITKILCTSKAGAMVWMRDRILIPDGFSIDEEESNSLHSYLLGQIENAVQEIKPVAQVLRTTNHIVNLVSLPSPGSPERRLKDFGYNKNAHSTKEYLANYLHTVFHWFNLN